MQNPPAPSGVPQGFWEKHDLETDLGNQPARRFCHPRRGSGFPDLYLLQDPHPLRPANFTNDNHPTCSRPFRDYVVTIHKTSEFMKRWDKTGSKTATPSDDVSANLESGMSPPTAIVREGSHSCTRDRVAAIGRGRYSVGSGS